MSKWERMPIGEIAEIFDGPHATPKKTESGPWFLSISSLKQGQLDLSESAHLSNEDFERWTRRITPREGDVLFSYETRLGEAALMPAGIQACLGRRMGLLRAKSGRADSRFLLYAYLAPDFQQVIRERSIHGATVDRIPLVDLPDWPIRIPSLTEQRAIAELLGALDDKIAVNSRVAEISRKLSTSIGRRLFAGTSGEIVALGSCADFVKGISYRSSDLGFGNYGLVSLKCVGRNGSFQPSGVKVYGGDYKPNQVVDNGDIVVAQTDLTQHAEVIGRPVRVLDLGKFSRLIASLDLIIVRPRPPLTREAILALLSMEEFHEHALSYCNGTTVVHLGSKALPEFKFNMPSPDALHSTTAEMAPLLQQADHVSRENHTLIKLRDALLPKLMSGEIRVRDAEKVVEDVT